MTAKVLVKLNKALKNTWNDDLEKCDKDHLPFRLWAKDSAMFTNKNEHMMLDWLDEPERMLDQYAKLDRIAENLLAKGFSHMVLLGMGGSSLAPHVFKEMLAPNATFFVLDSTHPESIKRIEALIDLPRTLFIVSSKSGFTLEPKVLFEYFWQSLEKAGVKDPLSHFTAITDPISPLEQLSVENGFLPGIFGRPGIGGRFSALSPFGMLPARLMGIDVERLLKNAIVMAELSGPLIPSIENPGIRLGLFLFLNASCKKNHLRIYCSKTLRPFGEWLLQLIAESLGKDGKGIVPILADDVRDNGYATHLFLTSCDDDDDFSKERLELNEVNTSVLAINIDDPYDIGQEMYRFEVGVAICGALWGLNPFDQPDVESSKELTRQTLVQWQSNQGFTKEKPAYQSRHIELYTGEKSNSTSLRSFLECIKPDEYLAILSFLDDSLANQQHINALKKSLASRYAWEVLSQVGPQYLHSTGQLFKGGESSGHFLILTETYPNDIKSPMPGLTFGNIHISQAIGDFLALEAKMRPVARLHFLNNAEGFKELFKLM